MFKDSTLNQIALIDLGLAKKCHEEKYQFVCCGTPGFVAPEIVNCHDEFAKFETISDMFGLGCIAHFLYIYYSSIDL